MMRISDLIVVQNSPKCVLSIDLEIAFSPSLAFQFSWFSEVTSATLYNKMALLGQKYLVNLQLYAHNPAAEAQMKNKHLGSWWLESLLRDLSPWKGIKFKTKASVDCREVP